MANLFITMILLGVITVFSAEISIMLIIASRDINSEAQELDKKHEVELRAMKDDYDRRMLDLEFEKALAESKLDLVRARLNTSGAK